jgi:hypothetical protein
MQIRNKAIPIIGFIICLLVVYIYNCTSPVLSYWGAGTNNKNFSTRTTVNVTNAYPEIINISCNNGTAITLNPGTTRAVSCLVQIRDYNGGGDINSTNGTLSYYLNQSSDPNDNNVHYTNASCTNGTPNNYYVNWTCSFDLWYYANNGTWRTNFTVKDNYNLSSFNDSRNVTISPLYALNVTPEINFGNMAVGDITGDPPIQANITNFGNKDINITIYGFGGEDPGATSLAMNCTIRNISISNERYSIDLSTIYASMTAMTGTPTNITGLKMPQQTNDNQQVINATYWRLNVNITNNPFGQCNGTVVFSAEIG